MFLNALDSGLIILDPAVEFLSVENLPTVVNVACCTNLLNDFSCEIYVKRLFRQKQLHHTGDHMKG